MTKRDFILRAKAAGSALTVAQLSTAYDALIVAMPADPAPPAVDIAPAIESDQVSAWLESLRKSDAAMFDVLRLNMYVDQHAAWISAGRPGQAG